MIHHVLGLNDDFLHGVLLVGGILGGSFMKAFVEWIGKKELRLVRRLVRKFFLRKASGT